MSRCQRTGRRRTEPQLFHRNVSLFKSLDNYVQETWNGLHNKPSWQLPSEYQGNNPLFMFPDLKGMIPGIFKIIKGYLALGTVFRAKYFLTITTPDEKWYQCVLKINRLLILDGNNVSFPANECMQISFWGWFICFGFCWTVTSACSHGTNGERGQSFSPMSWKQKKYISSYVLSAHTLTVNTHLETGTESSEHWGVEKWLHN